ncbi:MAG TPA: serine hydrolase domain-containing protein [Candidatus Baltobacteraceae bacterium]
MSDSLGVRFTAGVLRVERRGAAIFERAYGAVDAVGGSSVFVDTRFDIASLTKLFTSALALRYVQEGRVSLDALLTDIIPEWRKTAHRIITLRMLLAHTSGMQSGADYRTLLDDAIVRYALMRTLTATPGERVVYSDLGFIALGVLLERLSGASLAEMIHRYAALAGAKTAAYRPSAAEIPAIPATEEDGWRGRVRGAVHDEKAYLMNGVAGHAGLFATASDVAHLTEAFLGPLCGRSATLVALPFVRESVLEQGRDAVLRRGLGWALKTSDENSCGALMSRSTFGHTGFTGTCVWADPERDVQIVLLTNAVYYGRSDLRSVRAAVCDAVIQELDAC